MVGYLPAKGIVFLACFKVCQILTELCSEPHTSLPREATKIKAKSEKRAKVNFGIFGKVECWACPTSMVYIYLIIERARKNVYLTGQFGKGSQGSGNSGNDYSRTLLIG